MAKVAQSPNKALQSDGPHFAGPPLSAGGWTPRNGHFVGGEALQSARTAKTLRWKGGKILVTDGPFAETREQSGGLLVLEANDMNHAIELISRHPGVGLGGPFEIRPVETIPEVHPRIGME